MKGLVLTGGKSVRMGKDKGSLRYKGKNWAEIAGDKLMQSGISEVYFSVNESQGALYQNFFPLDTLISDQVPSVKGPLEGILSAHKLFPKSDWLIIPCDMLLFEVKMLNKLLASYVPCQMDYAGFADQPFPGIFSANFLSRVYSLALIGKLESYSIKKTLALGEVSCLSFSPAEETNFYNFNSTSDLSGLI
ncbi:MAG: molybdenum cofactor guanylyltransferase [Cytophagaceae bacterium]